MNDQAVADLADLLAQSLEQGGPTPLADALSRWRDFHVWQTRRPIERALGKATLALLYPTNTLTE